MNNRISSILLYIFTLSFLIGCASGPPKYYDRKEEDRLNKLVEASTIRNLCTGKRECELKWQRALSWVELNSSGKISIYEREYISTYEPLNNEDILGYSIKKVQLSEDGQYEISFKVVCNNVSNCNEKSLRATADFKYFVESGTGLKSNI